MGYGAGLPLPEPTGYVVVEKIGPGNSVDEVDEVDEVRVGKTMTSVKVDEDKMGDTMTVVEVEEPKIGKTLSEAVDDGGAEVGSVVVLLSP